MEIQYSCLQKEDLRFGHTSTIILLYRISWEMTTK